MKKLKLGRDTQVLKEKITSRGGGIEIEITKGGFKGVRMTAYQNYLGGGILGRVCSDCNIKQWQKHDELVTIAEELRKHFHSLTNPKGTWEDINYEQNQKMSASAY